MKFHPLYLITAWLFLHSHKSKQLKLLSGIQKGHVEAGTTFTIARLPVQDVSALS